MSQGKAAGLQKRLLHILRGGVGKAGAVKKIILYALLIGIGFVFLYPFLYMFVNSFMSPEDLLNPAVNWIPSGLYLENYVKAFHTLDFLKSLSLIHI